MGLSSFNIQLGSGVVTNQKRGADMLPANPRQRVSFNRSTPLTLDGSWQVINFGNNSAYDTNTFPTNRYNTTNNLILANPDTSYEQAYLLEIDLSIKPNAANYVIKPSIRFMVPAPTPLYFPLPDSQKRLELGYEITGTVETAMRVTYPVYTNALIRQYGAQIQISYSSQRMNTNLISGLVGVVSEALTGSQRPQLTDAVLNMYAM